MVDGEVRDAEEVVDVNEAERSPCGTRQRIRFGTPKALVSSPITQATNNILKASEYGSVRIVALPYPLNAADAGDAAPLLRRAKTIRYAHGIFHLA